MLFSIKVAVGQAWTHAPHETHSESRKSSLIPADTFDWKPRPSIVSANVPWTSSQARTQREHTMHFEASNWTWDPVAEQYYWHRFYSHQPDLNFDEPRVQEALLKVTHLEQEQIEFRRRMLWQNKVVLMKQWKN